MRRSLVLLAAGTIMGGAAAAQSQPNRAAVPPGAVVQPLGPDRGAELRAHLTTLSENPRSVAALIGAGRAALALGDAESSLSFFARAEAIEPRNARVKVGMATALVQLGQPQTALRLFDEAIALGTPVAEVASDRGLAYDMVGDPGRAQQDYVLAMRHRDEPELRRRMALSLAITDQRDAALRLIDAQLRGNDRAAWRTQAFVLALTGDAAGANRTAQNVMPAGTAQQMAPFLARLASLTPSQKAMAVHLGHFPSQSASAAGAPVSADPGALALALGGAPAVAGGRGQAPDAASRSTRRQTADASPRRTRRRPETTRDPSDPYRLRQSGSRESRPAQAASAPPPASPPRAAPVEQHPAQDVVVSTRWAGAPGVQAQPQPAPAQPQAPAPASPASPEQPATQIPAGAPAVSPPPAAIVPPPSSPIRVVSNAGALPVTVPAGSAPVQAAPSATVPSATHQLQTAQVPASATQPVRPQVAGPPSTGVSTGNAPLEPSAAGAGQMRSGLADIATVVNALPPEERGTTRPPAPAPRRAEPVRTAENRPDEPRTGGRQRAARPAHPSRHWVQIAGGANRAALPREFARLRALAPQQLGRREAFTVAARATNRLLVGPFPTERAAQEFVNQLADRSVAAFAWTSAAGQEIERLQAR